MCVWTWVGSSVGHWEGPKKNLLGVKREPLPKASPASMGGEASSSQRPPLADSEHARGHHRARAAGVGLGCPSQSALLTLVAFARHDFPASGQADDVDERGHAASTTPTMSHVTANPIPVTTEMDMELARSTTRDLHPFVDSSQSLLPEVQSLFDRQTVPRAEGGDRPIPLHTP